VVDFGWCGRVALVWWLLVDFDEVVLVGWWDNFDGVILRIL
jgi:hypothetical protein